MGTARWHLTTRVYGHHNSPQLSPFGGARGQSELLPRVCENNTNAPKGYDMEDTVTSGINEHKIIDSGVFLPPSFE